MKNKDIQEKANRKAGRKQVNNCSTPRSQSQKSSCTFDLTQSLILTSFKNHPGECLCKDCLCGRHMCKLEQSPPSISLASTYQIHYRPKAAPKYK